jgi:hypothetical protein
LSREEINDEKNRIENDAKKEILDFKITQKNLLKQLHELTLNIKMKEEMIKKYEYNQLDMSEKTKV